MNFAEVLSASTAASVALGAVVGVLAKAWADNASGGRKVWFDQLQLALGQVEKLQARSDAQDLREQALLKRIEALVVVNTRLEMQKKYMQRSLRPGPGAAEAASACAEFSMEEMEALEATPAETEAASENFIPGPRQ